MDNIGLFINFRIELFKRMGQGIRIILMILAALAIVALAFWITDGDGLLTTVLSLVVIIVILLARGRYGDFKEAEYKERKKKNDYLLLKKKNQLKLEDIRSEYGLDVNIVNYKLSKFFVADERHSILLINDKEYHFSDILNYSISDNSKTIYSSIVSISETDTGNSIGRAIIGGILGGNAGAIIAGTTGDVTTKTSGGKSTTQHDYSIKVTVYSISNPLEIIHLGTNEDATSRIAAILNVLLVRNSKNLAR